MEIRPESLRAVVAPEADPQSTLTAGEPPVPQSYREREHSSTVAGIIVLTSPGTLETAGSNA